MLSLKKALLDANFEIYGEDATALRLAERHRYHLMDAGVDVAPVAAAGDRGAEGEPELAFLVRFTARAQKSDFPHVESSRIYAAIRAHFGEATHEHGFRVDDEAVHEVADPVDGSRILDVWFETRFAKRVESLDAVIEEVRWALALEKYVRPDS